MPSTLDVKEAIKQTLFQNWKLHGELSRQNLTWSTGVTAASRSYPSIEVVDVSDPTRVLTTIWLMRDALCMIHIWVRPNTHEKNAIEKAKHQKHLIIEEVIRLLWSDQIEVQDVSWAHPLDHINADQYTALDDDVGEANQSSAAESRGEFTPILHEIFPVQAKRFFNAYTGGVQMNRTT